MKSILQKLRLEFPVGQSPVEVRERLVAGPAGAKASEGLLSVAISGGADSVFLVLWVLAHVPGAADRVQLLHFNHRTRPEENEVEERAVRARAEEWGLPLRVGEETGNAGTSESDFRASRFAFFSRAMEESGSRCLLLGHQADDVAETVLARLARGSGVEGLAAPRPVSFHREPWPHERVRPLLLFPAGGIRDFLVQNQVSFVEDSSNEGVAFQRNRLRHQVMPAWKDAVGRDLLRGVGRAVRSLGEVADFVEATARDLAPGGWSSERMLREPLRRSHRAPVRFLVQRWLADRRCEISPESVDGIVESLLGGSCGKWSAGRGAWVVVDEKWLRWVEEEALPQWNPVPWVAGTEMFLPGGAVLRRKIVPGSDKFFEQILSGAVADSCNVFLQVEEGVESLLTVRQWQAGDRFRPLGAPGERKLQDWFTDRKIDAALRRRLPVIARGERILWVPGFPPAHQDRVTRPKDALLGLTYVPA